MSNMEARARFPKWEAPNSEKKENSATARRKQTPVRSLPVAKFLSARDEWKLINRWRLKNDGAALDKVVRAYLPFVRARAAKFSSLVNEGADGRKDAISAGTLGLLKALQKFDPNRGVRLSTYAQHWIDAEIRQLAQSRFSVVKTPRGEAARLLADRKQQFRALNGRDPTDAELYMMRQQGRDVSLDEPDESPCNREKQFVSPDLAQDLVVAQAQERRRYLATFAAALAQLSGREQRIYWDRNIAERQLTFAELGRRFSISAERARQLEQKAEIHVANHFKKANAEGRLSLAKASATISKSWLGLEQRRAAYRDKNLSEQTADWVARLNNPRIDAAWGIPGARYERRSSAFL